MPDLSPFQTLPIHIAEAIGYYCVGLQRHRNKCTTGINESTEMTWLVLHDVSRSWMQLACKNLNKSVFLRLSKDPESNKFTTSPHSDRVIEQSTAIIPQVKDICIYFDDIVEEPNEEEPEKFGRVWPEDFVFPKARSLTCYTGYTDSARTIKYFEWFAERVQSSFPNLQETRIEFDDRTIISIVSPGVLHSKEWDVGLFLSALFRTAMWRMGDIPSPAYMSSKNILIQNMPELTSFSCTQGFYYEFADQIVKKSVVTLEKLRYGWSCGGGFKDFLFDDDGQVIVYPRLRDLRVFDSSDDKGELMTDKSIVPFPALRRLGMYSSCVFKDDTLFRGFNGTLACLDIGLRRDIVDISQTYKVFSQGACPNLSHIIVRYDVRRGLTLSYDEYIEAAFGLVSLATQSMTINGSIPYQHIKGVIPTCPHLDNIQILILKTSLSLLEVLDIFKYFPHVTDFGCSFRRIDSELVAIQDKLIPSHLGTRYSRFVSRLKCWHMYYSGGASVEEMAVLFVTLAVLCPSFTYVDEWKNNREAYGSKIEYILSSGLYDQHAKRLGNLFKSR